MAILAIDQGTSGTKALVHDEGRVLAVVERPVYPFHGAEGSVELDPTALLESVLTAGRLALEEAGRPSIEMVSLANQGESVLAWDPVEGRPLSPVLVWQDRRAEGICETLRPHADVVAERTGLVLDPYFSAPKMAWIRRQLTREGVVTTTDSWLVHQLTGAFVTDATTASRSLLLDLNTLSWDGELAELFGLGDEAMPQVVANDAVVGGTTAFGGEMPVGGLIVDQQAALVAQRCLAPGEAKCTFGTGAFLLANAGSIAPRSTHGITTSLGWTVDEGRAYCLDAQAYTLGSAVRWLTELGVLSSPERLDAESAPDRPRVGSTGGADGPVFVPALAGMASPWWTAEPAGALLGMGLATSRGEVVRAVVEGLASQIAVLARLVGTETGAPLTHLRVDGGLTRSSVLMQTQANLLQVPLECYPSAHATAIGAVSMARLAVGSERSLAEAVPTWEPTRTFVPQWSADRAAATLARWEAAVDQVLTGEATP